MFMKFIDGGTDQGKTSESVKCSAICICEELNLDMYIAARCAPGNSWINSTERIMSILNLGLQNCAMERENDASNAIKSCNSMNQIRDVVSKKPELLDIWQDVINPVKHIVRSRFERLSLKNEPIQTIYPATEVAISNLQQHLRQLFPDLDVTDLVKSKSRKSLSYQNWIEIHCRQRQYTFQIRKCQDSSCCNPPVSGEWKLEWLQFFLKTRNITVPNQGLRVGIQQIQIVRLQKKKLNKNLFQLKNQAENTSLLPDNIGTGNSSLFTAQNARYTVECRKVRVIFSKNRLTTRQQTHLILTVSESEYTCGAHISVPGDILDGLVHVRQYITCAMPVEVSYYSSNISRNDICCYCSGNNAEVSQEKKKQYKTLLPICMDCQKEEEIICYRPYGEKSKN
ncbi:hypothetical protein SNE40_013462 [Patella caerulea]|uniref:Uncharacterized protein n=1 Tax=Patella caerulea TaxID=87958 RepID=A0AAN8PQR8_PATCE